MRHSAGRRVLASRSAAAQAQRVGRGPLETPTRGDKPLDPKVEGSLVGCARGYALSYVAGGGVGTRSVAIGGVVCVLLIGALFYMFLTVLIVIPNKPLGDVRNLIALHCITL